MTDKPETTFHITQQSIEAWKDDLLWLLNIWGDMQYEDGCEWAHKILLSYRERLRAAVEAYEAQSPISGATGKPMSDTQGRGKDQQGEKHE